MKNLSIAFIVAVSFLSVAGCKKKGGGDYMAKMTEFKDAMCKCADKACADKVTADMQKWTTDMAKEGGDKAAAVSEEDAKKMAPINEEFAKCAGKAMMAGMTPPAGDKPMAPAGDKPADPNMAPAGDKPMAPAGDKPADPAAPAAPAAPAGDKPAGDKPAN
jgi:hypothetical protein